MKALLFGVAIFAATAGIGTSAKAGEYPWCAEYSKGGGRNCGFVSFDQCLATISGVGGFCSRNYSYQSSAPMAYAPSGTHGRNSRRHYSRKPS